MEIIVLRVKPASNSWFSLCEEEYKKKIKHFTRFDIVSVKSLKKSREDQSVKKKKESEFLIKSIAQDDFVILCDEKGSELDSLKFSKKLQQWIELPKRRIVFVVGGAYGVEKTLFERANFKWSFSSLVLNHVVSQVVLLEQLYRALSIINNRSYHNE